MHIYVHADTYLQTHTCIWLSGQTKSSQDFRRFRQSGAIRAYSYAVAASFGSHLLWRLPICEKSQIKSGRTSTNRRICLREMPDDFRRVGWVGANIWVRMYIFVAWKWRACGNAWGHPDTRRRAHICIHTRRKRGNVCYYLLSLANPTVENSSNFHSEIFFAIYFKHGNVNGSGK